MMGEQGTLFPHNGKVDLQVNSDVICIEWWIESMKHSSGSFVDLYNYKLYVYTLTYGQEKFNRMPIGNGHYFVDYPSMIWDALKQYKYGD